VWEPALLLLYFSVGLSQDVLTNQMLKQTCLVYGYNVTDCDKLGETNETRLIEEKIQPNVAKIQASIEAIDSIIPAIIALFLCPWSDRYGRKKVMNASFVGYTCFMLCMCIICYISDYVTTTDPWNYLFAYLLLAVTGSWTSLVISVSSLVSDISNEENLSLNLSIMEAIIVGGGIIGTACSSYVYQWTNTSSVFGIAFLCAFIATILIVFFVDESIKTPENVGIRQQIKELLSPNLIKKMIRTSMKQRSFKGRKVLWSLIVIVMLFTFTQNGSTTVTYLFERKAFSWSLKQATIFEAIHQLLSIIGCFVGLTLLKKTFNFGNFSLIFMASMSVIIEALIKAFATEGWEMYFSSFIGSLKTLPSPICRSLIATIIPTNEIGAIFSLTNSLEAVATFFAAPMYGIVYSTTLTYFPGAFYLITTCAFVIVAALATSIRENLNDSYMLIEGDVITNGVE